jgi:NADP-dependent 3-hydroxy acid dehydrogenase YdfG/Flp pilus assembly protein TadD
MEQQHIALAYCIDNVQLAEELAQELSSVGHAPQHYYGSKKSPEKPLFDQLASHSGPILLLVTDNFLRSAQCMANGREFMQDNRDAVLPIVADGVRQDESRTPQTVPTQFERISDIIQYINYWQDQYLDLRRQKRELEDEINETSFNDHLRTVRAISGETSEFLRLLRNTEHVTYEELNEEHYEHIFRFIGDMSSWEKLKKARVAKVMERVPVEAADTELVEEPPVSEEEHEAHPELPDASGPDEIVPDEPEDEIVTDTTAHQETTDAGVEEEGETKEIPSASEPDPIPLNGALHTEEELAEEEETMEQEAAEPEETDAAADPDFILENLHDWVSGGQTEEAISQLRKGLEQHPEHLAMRYQLAHLLVQHEDDFTEARQQLAALLKYDSKHTGALFLSGELSEIEEDFDEAVGFYQDVAAIDSRYPEVHYRLGLILAHQFEDTQDHAITEFRQAIAQDPENADAHYQYGMLLNEHQEALDAAAHEFNETLRLQPNHPFAYYDLAIIYHTQGEMEKAQEAYLKAKALNPEVETPENDLAFGLTAAEEASPKADASENGLETEVTDQNTTAAEEETPRILPTELSDDTDLAEATTEKSDRDLLIERDALAALKENIFRLEEMIKARDEEKEKLKQQRPGNGKTVLVTGATSGIGKATAEVFAQNGFRLIITGRRSERLENIKNELQEAFEVDIHELNFDVRDIKEVENAINNLPEDWKNIDILINNAGKAKGLDPVHEGRLEHWEEMIDTNLKGLLYLTRAVSPAMVERREGQIINVCSTAGKEVYPNGNVYCATKHAVDALTKAMRLDLHSYNIRVGQVAPAHVEETEFAEVRFDGDKDRGDKVYEGFQPLRAADVAEAIYFMATRPAHVNVQDVVLLGTQQASSTVIDRSGR